MSPMLMGSVVFILVAIVAGFFAHIFWFRGEQLKDKLKSILSGLNWVSTSEEFRSKFYEYEGGGVISAFRKDSCVIYLYRFLISENMKFKWYLVLEKDIDTKESGVFGKGYIPSVCKQNKIYKTIEKVIPPEILEGAEIRPESVELCYGKKIIYFPLGGLVGGSNIMKSLGSMT
ncbi:MAG: hypothetical protein K6L73_14760 [Cellvibrionaceae bacterium]